jgi:hypothetical protein
MPLSIDRDQITWITSSSIERGTVRVDQAGNPIRITFLLDVDPRVIDIGLACAQLHEDPQSQLAARSLNQTHAPDLAFIDPNLPAIVTVGIYKRN